MTSRKIIFVNFLTLSFFILDRFLKKLVTRGITGKVFFIEFSEFKNPWIALSIPLKGYIFYFLLIIILYFVVYGLIKAWREKDGKSIFAFSLILTGAFSNILDRITYGAVIDYLNLPHLTAFNVADLMILTGVIILFLRIILSKRIVL